MMTILNDLSLSKNEKTVLQVVIAIDVYNRIEEKPTKFSLHAVQILAHCLHVCFSTIRVD